MIKFKTPKTHWNYFLAIEKDLENISRYIEFSEDNLETYSIELTHILLSASSEVDVILKQICLLIDSSQTAKDIDRYRDLIKNKLSNLINEEISIDRFGISCKPWENWSGDQNPDWWRSYNNVKHRRHECFQEANLRNTINAVGALLIVVTYYYQLSFSKEINSQVSFRETTQQLNPKATLLTINADYYYSNLIV
jgi:hypothetical protein